MTSAYLPTFRRTTVQQARTHAWPAWRISQSPADVTIRDDTPAQERSPFYSTVRDLVMVGMEPQIGITLSQLFRSLRIKYLQMLFKCSKFSTLTMIFKWSPMARRSFEATLMLDSSCQSLAQFSLR